MYHSDQMDVIVQFANEAFPVLNMKRLILVYAVKWLQWTTWCLQVCLQFSPERLEHTPHRR